MGEEEEEDGMAEDMGEEDDETAAIVCVCPWCGWSLGR